MRLLTSFPRRLTGVAAIACAATLIPVASLAATASPAAPAPRCLEHNLATGLFGYESGRYDNQGQGGFILTLTNTGSGACSLKGYPGLGLQNARHHTVRSRTHWGSTYFAADPGRHLIVLSPGETAVVPMTPSPSVRSADRVGSRAGSGGCPAGMWGGLPRSGAVGRSPHICRGCFGLLSSA